MALELRHLGRDFDRHGLERNTTWYGVADLGWHLGGLILRLGDLHVLDDDLLDDVPLLHRQIDGVGGLHHRRGGWHLRFHGKDEGENGRRDARQDRRGYSIALGHGGL